jgi:hypothetical protein
MQMDVAPQRQHPIVDLDGGRDGDDGVVVAKKAEIGAMPLTYMWCAQTTKLSAPMPTMAQTIIR